MNILKISGKHEAPGLIHKHQITHTLCLLDPSEDLGYNPDILFDLQSHTRFDFCDVEWESYYSAPNKQNCENILNWSKDIPQDANVLIHCHAGISRSTCSALAIMVQRYPNMTFTHHKNELLRIRPIAFPNKLMAVYFDELLNMNGDFKNLVLQIHREQDLRYTKGSNGYINGTLG